MVDHTLTQLEGELGAVVIPGPFGGKLRHDFQIVVNVDELVTEGLEDQTSGIGSSLRRVECVGIVLQSHFQAGGAGG